MLVMFSLRLTYHLVMVSRLAQTWSYCRLMELASGEGHDKPLGVGVAHVFARRQISAVEVDVEGRCRLRHVFGEVYLKVVASDFLQVDLIYKT